MRKNKTRTNEKNPIKKSLVIYAAAIISEIISLCLLLSFFSVLITKSDLGAIVTAVFAVFSFAISAFISGFIAVRPKRKDGIVTGLLASLPVFLISSLVLLGVKGGNPGYTIFITLGAQLIFGIVGGITAANLRSKLR